MPDPLRKVRKPYVRWSPAVADAVCDGLAQGISLRRLGALPDYPSPQQVRAWMRVRPDFAERIAQARTAGGIAGPGRHSRYDEAAIDIVFHRLARGEPLYLIARDPALPCLMTLYNWTNARPRLGRLLWVARDLHHGRLSHDFRGAIAGLSEEDARGDKAKALRHTLGRAAGFKARKAW